MNVPGYRRPVLAVALLAAASAVYPADTSLGLLPRDGTAPPVGGVLATPGGLKPGSDPFSLLESPEVQRALGLKQEQIVELRRANPLFSSRIAGVAHSAAASSAAELDRLLWTSRGAIANALTPQQQIRFRQIVVQQGGPCLIADDRELQRALDVNEALRGEIADACRALATKLHSEIAPPAPGTDPCNNVRDDRVRIDRLLREGEEEILALLTPDRRRSLEELKGAAVRLPPRADPQCPPDSAQTGTNVTRTEE